MLAPCIVVGTDHRSDVRDEFMLESSLQLGDEELANARNAKNA
jgi:hypothetical protein